jgi:hypothetical protein
MREGVLSAVMALPNAEREIVVLYYTGRLEQALPRDG